MIYEEEKEKNLNRGRSHDHKAQSQRTVNQNERKRKAMNQFNKIQPNQMKTHSTLIFPQDNCKYSELDITKEKNFPLGFLPSISKTRSKPIKSRIQHMSIIRERKKIELFLPGGRKRQENSTTGIKYGSAKPQSAQLRTHTTRRKGKAIGSHFEVFGRLHLFLFASIWRRTSEMDSHRGRPQGQKEEASVGRQPQDAIAVVQLLSR